MRELLRGETAGRVGLPEATRDECVRVLFAAGGPVRVALVDKAGAVLASSTNAALGVLDARGPVCFHADAAPELVVQSDAGPVRFVVWAPPSTPAPQGALTRTTPHALP